MEITDGIKGVISAILHAIDRNAVDIGTTFDVDDDTAAAFVGFLESIAE